MRSTHIELIGKLTSESHRSDRLSTNPCSSCRIRRRSAFVVRKSGPSDSMYIQNMICHLRSSSWQILPLIIENRFRLLRDRLIVRIVPPPHVRQNLTNMRVLNGDLLALQRQISRSDFAQPRFAGKLYRLIRIVEQLLSGTNSASHVRSLTINPATCASIIKRLRKPGSRCWPRLFFLLRLC